MTEFSMDLSIEVFHPPIVASLKRDQSRVTVGVTPMSNGQINLMYQAFSETVPVTQRDAAVARVVKATMDAVMERNEQMRSRE